MSVTLSGLRFFLGDWKDTLLSGDAKALFLGSMVETVVIAHLNTLEVMLCCQKPTAIRLKTQSEPQVLLKCRHVDLVKQQLQKHISIRCSAEDERRLQGSKSDSRK